MNFFKRLLSGANDKPGNEPDEKSNKSRTLPSRVHYQKGIELDNAGNVSEAIQEFTRAIEMDNHPMAYYCRACIYQDMYNYREAIADFKSYIKYVPEKTRENIAAHVCIEELEEKLRNKR
jgi:tetratricopeptide (TPR) repeat protein